MTLADGTYIIASMNGKHPIGRHFVEDLSLLPKRVMVLPASGPGLHIGGSSTSKFEIHASGNEKFKIKANGSYVGVLQDRVVAFLLEDMIQGAEWKIEHVPQHGTDAYIIIEADREYGWSARDEVDTQVTVEPSVSTKSLPPMYPANHVFTFTRA